VGRDAACAGSTAGGKRREATGPPSWRCFRQPFALKLAPLTQHSPRRPMRLTALQSDAHGPSDLDRTGTTSVSPKRNLSEPFFTVTTVEYCKNNQSSSGVAERENKERASLSSPCLFPFLFPTSNGHGSFGDDDLLRVACVVGMHGSGPVGVGSSVRCAVVACGGPRGDRGD
jgi:hypothetical protein